ncbi:MAG: hypothetical protein WAU58_19660 [Terriglobales bacterium]
MLQFQVILTPEKGGTMQNLSLRTILGVAILGASLSASQAQGQPTQDQASQDQPAQGQSLGDVAKAQRQKKAASTKVIDDEEMAQRRAHRGNGDPALQCDDACVAAVKLAVQQDGRLQMTAEQWQTSLAAGEDELIQDDEWSQLFSDFRQQFCRRTSGGTVDPAKAGDLDRRVAKKLLDDAQKSMEVLGHAMQAGTSQAAINQAADAARAKAMKLYIIRVQVERAKQSCNAPTQPAKPASAN